MRGELVGGGDDAGMSPAGMCTFAKSGWGGVVQG